MSRTTMELPLRLYQNRTSQDIHNDIARKIGELTPAVADRPDWITTYAQSIERLRGQADVLELLEKSFYQIVHWGVEQGWTMQEILLAQYDEVASLALQHPDDTGGTRNNDGKRAYNDGRREVLYAVQSKLRRDEWFPGNKKKESN